MTFHSPLDPAAAPEDRPGDGEEDAEEEFPVAGWPRETIVMVIVGAVILAGIIGFVIGHAVTSSNSSAGGTKPHHGGLCGFWPAVVDNKVPSALTGASPPAGVYVWASLWGAWHVRVIGLSGVSGSVAENSGSLVAKVVPGGQGSVNQNQGGASVSFTFPAGGTTGFDFTGVGKYTSSMTMDFLTDTGPLSASQIEFGKNGGHPKSNPFTLTRIAPANC